MAASLAWDQAIIDYGHDTVNAANNDLFRQEGVLNIENWQ